ncbi:MAG: hypothetical protein MJ236_05825, partial [Clostridia bacterium]|nr:hypothetical protein [Clostridia bacterium]
NEYIGNVMKDMDCTPRLVIDGVIDAVDITEQTAESVALLEPYGAGNPIPVFLLRDCEITDIAALSAGKHTRMTLAKDGCSIYSVFFGTNLVEEGYMVGDKIDVVYNIDINEFRGNRNVQLILKDVDRTNSDKVRLSDYAQKAKTDSLKIEKFTRNEVPTRYDFEILYRQITSISSEYVNIRALAKSLPEYSVQKLLMMLKVFQEAGIMDVVEDKKRILVYKVVVLKTKEKVDLFRTPTMQRFFNR